MVRGGVRKTLLRTEHGQRPTRAQQRRANIGQADELNAVEQVLGGAQIDGIKLRHAIQPRRNRYPRHIEQARAQGL